MLTWWRHQMETFSVLLAICAGNSPVPGEFPAQRPVTRSSDVFFDLHGWVNNGEAGDLRRHRAHYDVTIMITEAEWRIHIMHQYTKPLVQIMACRLFGAKPLYKSMMTYIDPPPLPKEHIQWNMIWNSNVFIQENAWENILYEMTAIFSRQLRIVNGSLRNKRLWHLN